MDPTLEEKQKDQPQEKQRQGIIGRGIGRIGTRVATQTALRGFSALLASQVGLPILIAIIAVFVLTFIIVGFGGAPPAQTNQPTSPSITPTPVVPL